MSVKVQSTEDASVVMVLVPHTPHGSYDPSDGLLYDGETIGVGELRKAIKAATGKGQAPAEEAVAVETPEEPPA